MHIDLRKHADAPREHRAAPRRLQHELRRVRIDLRRIRIHLRENRVGLRKSPYELRTDVPRHSNDLYQRTCIRTRALQHAAGTHACNQAGTPSP